MDKIHEYGTINRKAYSHCRGKDISQSQTYKHIYRIETSRKKIKCIISARKFLKEQIFKVDKQSSTKSSSGTLQTRICSTIVLTKQHETASKTKTRKRKQLPDIEPLNVELHESEDWIQDFLANFS